MNTEDMNEVALLLSRRSSLTFVLIQCPLNTVSEPDKGVGVLLVGPVKLLSITMTWASCVGCGLQQSSEYQRRYRQRSGILGLGPSKISLITQLASSKKTPKSFAHCLDGDIGGTLIIGDIVDEMMTKTPLYSDMEYYNIKLEAVYINGEPLPVDKSIFKKTMVDSGTTLGLISEEYFQPLVTAIMRAQPSITYTMQESYCFFYNGSIDQAFPIITFKFEGSAIMDIPPHDYLLLRPDNAWCIGWRSTGSIAYHDKDTTILGDLVLKNKLFGYDMEKGTIGWTNYDCSKGILLKSDKNEAATVHQLVTRRLWFLFVSLLTSVLLIS